MSYEILVNSLYDEIMSLRENEVSITEIKRRLNNMIEEIIINIKEYEKSNLKGVEE